MLSGAVRSLKAPHTSVVSSSEKRFLSARCVYVCVFESGRWPRLRVYRCPLAGECDRFYFFLTVSDTQPFPAGGGFSSVCSSSPARVSLILAALHPSIPILGRQLRAAVRS